MYWNSWCSFSSKDELWMPMFWHQTEPNEQSHRFQRPDNVQLRRDPVANGDSLAIKWAKNISARITPNRTNLITWTSFWMLMYRCKKWLYLIFFSLASLGKMVFKSASDQVHTYSALNWESHWFNSGRTRCNGMALSTISWEIPNLRWHSADRIGNRVGLTYRWNSPRNWNEFTSKTTAPISANEKQITLDVSGKIGSNNKLNIVTDQWSRQTSRHYMFARRWASPWSRNRVQSCISCWKIFSSKLSGIFWCAQSELTTFFSQKPCFEWRCVAEYRILRAWILNGHGQKDGCTYPDILSVGTSTDIYPDILSILRASANQLRIVLQYMQAGRRPTSHERIMRCISEDESYTSISVLISG